MAAPSSSSNHNAVPQDTPITIKITVNDNLKKLKLPLRDLGPNVLPDKLRQVLGIKPDHFVVFERFSDSAGGFITLDPQNPQVFKTLIRAAKAKLKLRLKATVTPAEQPAVEEAASPMRTDRPAQPSYKTMEPVIVRSPVPQSAQRVSTALDRRSVGSGIFQFREARASQQTLVDIDEAPIPRPFTADTRELCSDLACRPSTSTIRTTELPIREAEPIVLGPIATRQPWSVYCNECDKQMSDAHFHCSICDGGDYDLCEECVAGGNLCPGEGHWLIKRFIKEGRVITSTTERISPRARQPARVNDILNHQESPGAVGVKQGMPGAFADDTKTLADEPRLATRTCNNCVVVLPECGFVTCLECEDFDLCVSCHVDNKHGHHPAHTFEPATEETNLSMNAEAMLNAGRNVRHHAICDGCDGLIYGVRHKCFDCPDWDFCNNCIKTSDRTHPRHRFAAIYQPLPVAGQPFVRHHGIYCDGPLCTAESAQVYITGVRYKCAVCHDTDFCSRCEASPANQHNRTHPLIKFKTPVRNVNITTENEDVRGNVRMMGDRRPATTAAPHAKNASTKTTPVQTIAEIQPTADDGKEDNTPQPIPIFQSEKSKDVPSEAVPSALLNAHFVQDSIEDGTVLLPGTRFTQIWTLKNVGSYAWPAGCSVRYIGGDNMLNVDNGHPASVNDIAEASESNVIGREVQVGEAIAFKVTLKAPLRAGKAISYWRIKAPDGTPFGHRLWCDIEVKNAEQSTPATAEIEAPLPGHLQQAQMAQMLGMQPQQLLMQIQRAQHQAAMLGQAAGNLPAYSEGGAQQTVMHNSDVLAARLANMRAEQQKRLESMMAQLTVRQNMPGAVAAAPTMGMTDDDKARKEAAKQRVEHIKAKIMRSREERARQLAAVAKQSAAVSAPQQLEPVDFAVPMDNRSSVVDAREATDGELDAAVQQLDKPVAASEDHQASKLEQHPVTPDWQCLHEMKATTGRSSQSGNTSHSMHQADAVKANKPTDAQANAAKMLEQVKADMHISNGHDDQPTDSHSVAGQNGKMKLSTMVFPRLDKESPSSSTYASAESSKTMTGKGKAAYVENEDGEIERSASPSTASSAPAQAADTEPNVTSPMPSQDDEETFEDLGEEIEVLSAAGEEFSEDDGFATDEEYDILDASDQETVASK